MPSLKEKHFSRFHTNICTLLFVIIFQVNIWSAVKSIHASPYSYFHFIINFEEHYFKCKHDLWDHTFPLSPFPVLLFFPRHSVKFTWSEEMELLPTHITWTLWIMMCVTTMTLQLQDLMCWILQLQDKVKCISGQLLGCTRAQVGGMPCKHQLAKPQYFHHLHSDKHSVARSWQAVEHRIPQHRVFGIQDWAELGTKHNAIVIMKCLTFAGQTWIPSQLRPGLYFYFLVCSGQMFPHWCATILNYLCTSGFYTQIREEKIKQHPAWPFFFPCLIWIAETHPPVTN